MKKYNFKSSHIKPKYFKVVKPIYNENKFFKGDIGLWTDIL